MDAQPTFSEIVARTLRQQKGVTFRSYGNGLQRPMIHRWDANKIRGAITLQQHHINTLLRHNPLYDRLSKRGR